MLRYPPFFAGYPLFQEYYLVTLLSAYETASGGIFAPVVALCVKC
jgi:hypothetical protein